MLPVRLLALAHAAVLLTGGAVLATAGTAEIAGTADAVRPAATASAAVADLAPRRTATPLAAPAPVAPVGEVAVPAARRDVASPPQAAAPVRRLSPQERGEAALASLDYPWQALGYAVVFRPSTGRTAGLADPRTRTITVSVRPDHDELQLRATIAHELGHALDFEHGDDERRRQYRELRGLPAGSAWFPCDACEDYASPAGDWAEVFAAVLVGNGDFRSRLAGPPSPQHVERLRALFAVPAPTPAPVEAPAEGPRPEPEPEQDEGWLLPW